MEGRGGEEAQGVADPKRNTKRHLLWDWSSCVKYEWMRERFGENGKICWRRSMHFLMMMARGCKQNRHLLCWEQKLQNSFWKGWEPVWFWALDQMTAWTWVATRATCSWRRWIFCPSDPLSLPPSASSVLKHWIVHISMVSLESTFNLY
jgi:hypothetical protein